MGILSLPAYPNSQRAAAAQPTLPALGKPRRGSPLFKTLMAVVVLVPTLYLRWMLMLPAPAMPSAINEENFNKIERFMEEFEVRAILGGPGIEADEPEWPKTLADLPGQENGLQFRIQLSDGTKSGIRFAIEGTREVWWKKWDDPVQDRWIAVGFFILGEGGSLSLPKVIAKRKCGF